MNLKVNHLSHIFKDIPLSIAAHFQGYIHLNNRTFSKPFNVANMTNRMKIYQIFYYFIFTRKKKLTRWGQRAMLSLPFSLHSLLHRKKIKELKN